MAARICDGKRREKKLSHLVEEVAEHLPRFRSMLEKVRDYGNEYVHPKKSQTSKESLFHRKKAAQESVVVVVQLVEVLYLAKKKT